MRNECNIIRDLLPLYAEKMVSPDTADFVEEHLKGCEACQKEYEAVQGPRLAQETVSAVPLKKLDRKLKIKRVQTIALTAVFVMALFVSAFAVLDAPLYFPYSEGIVELGNLGDTGITLTFDENVTDFHYTLIKDPDSDNYTCSIEAWTSLWDKWFTEDKGKLSATVPSQSKPMFIVYVPNDGSESVCLAKYDQDAENPIETNTEYEGTVALPRLSLGYYLILAAAALAVLALVWLLTRKKTKLRIWVERFGLYPIAYILSHCIVSGIRWTSYSLPRDFALIIFLSILLYSGLLLVHNIWYAKKMSLEE